MHYNDNRIGSTELGAWTLDFFETAGPAGYLSSSVDVLMDGKRKARLSLVRPNLAADEVIAQLRQRAERWIIEYEERDGAASTGFGVL